MQIINLRSFVVAVLSEFWNKNPELYKQFKAFLQVKIEQLNNKEITEEDYITEWLNKYPGSEL